MKAEDEKWRGKRQPDWNHKNPQRNQWRWDEGGAKNLRTIRLPEPTPCPSAVKTRGLFS